MSKCTIYAVVTEPALVFWAEWNPRVDSNGSIIRALTLPGTVLGTLCGLSAILSSRYCTWGREGDCREMWPAEIRTAFVRWEWTSFCWEHWNQRGRPGRPSGGSAGFENLPRLSSWPLSKKMWNSTQVLWLWKEVFCLPFTFWTILRAIINFWGS